MTCKVTTYKGEKYTFKWRKDGATKVVGSVVIFRSGCFSPDSVPKPDALNQIGFWLKTHRGGDVIKTSKFS